jgi:hypothetical protein
MSYVILNGDGSGLTIIQDGQIDSSSTSLTLIGREAVSYGQSLNQNFVYLLENFANVTPPNNSKVGQLWFDTTHQKLKIKNNSGFSPINVVDLSIRQPTTQIPGEFYFNTLHQTLHFLNNSSYYVTIPSYLDGQVSGLNNSVISDNASLSHSVALVDTYGNTAGALTLEAFTASTNDSSITFSRANTSSLYLVNGLTIIGDIKATNSLYSTNGNITNLTATNFVLNGTDILTIINNSTSTVYDSLKPEIISIANSTTDLLTDYTNLSSDFNSYAITTTNSINEIQQQYSLTIDNNGSIIGYQLIGGGTTSSFVINADNFEIYTSGGNKNPFSVSGSDVYIQGNSQSSNFITGSSGWQILNSGYSEFNNPVISRNIAIASGTFPAFQGFNNIDYGTPVAGGTYYYQTTLSIDTGVVKETWVSQKTTFQATVGINPVGVTILNSSTGYISTSNGIISTGPDTINISMLLRGIAYHWSWNGNPHLTIDVDFYINSPAGTAVSQFGLFNGSTAGGIDWTLYGIT